MVLSALVLAGMAAGATAWRAQSRETEALVGADAGGGFVTVDGARVHYVQMGRGPDLVMIHGASGSLREFTFALMPRLADRYRVTAFDRPGLGLSDPLPVHAQGLAAQATRLRAAAAELGITDPLILGHSYGGSVALGWALQEQPRALILVSAPSLPWPGTLNPWYRATDSAFGRAVIVPLVAAWVPMSFVRGAIEAVFAPETAPPGYADHIGVGYTVRGSVLAANAAQVNELRPEIVTMEAHYPGLTLPVELVHGDTDTIVPLEIHSQRLVTILPDARLTVLQGAGHMPHQTRPDAVIAAIDRAAARAALP